LILSGPDLIRASRARVAALSQKGTHD
jgi:hypothetical protein